MKVTKEALVASRALHGLGTVSLNVTGSCEEEQVMSDVASLVQASLAHPTSEAADVMSVSQAEAHSVTSMLWSSEGILRQALLSPGLVNFAGPDEEKQNKDSASSLDLVNIKNPGTPLPPMSELPRPGSLPGTMSLGPSSENQLLAETLVRGNRNTSVPATNSLESSLLDLHSTETFSGALSQFPCSVAYKLTTSPELLTSHASMDPLPPISEVHKAAAGQLMSSSVSSRDQLLSSQGREKDLATYQPSSSPLPSDVAGSLLLSSARGPLPTMSSSQVSSLLSALSSDLSNPEMPSKELASLSEIELSPPRKLSEQLGLNTSKVSMLQLHLSSNNARKVSTLTQTDQLDELENLIPLAPSTSAVNDSSNKLNDREEKTTILSQLEIMPAFTSNLTELTKCVSSQSFNPPVLSLNECQEPLLQVKQEKSVGQNAKKSKSSEPKKPRVRKRKTTEAKKSLVERVACFKCSMCPFLSLDKAGVDQHIEDEHGGLEEECQQGQSEPPAQELRCPGCPNVFFSTQSLQVHLIQDHRVSDAEVQQILDCLCVPPSQQSASEPVTEFTFVDTTEPPLKVERRTRKRSKAAPPPDVEVYTDEQGKIHVRPNTLPSDPAAPEGACSSGGDACESSDNDAEPTSEPLDEDEDSEKQAVRRRGRPRGSRNIGITALRRQNPSLRLGEKELGYCCAVNGCAVRLRSHDKIEYHRRCHTDGTDGNLFLCPECRHGFTQWRLLTSHLWRAHVIDMELYACDQCSFKTNSYSKLVNLHKRIHGVERPFLCDTCGKGFKTNKQLRNHKVIHNTIRTRPLKSGECDICLRHFTDKRMLRLHKDTVHEKLRPFLCNYCGYAASSRSTLKMHMRQHTGEKPFACPDCAYRTADHNSLRRHRMRHSGQKQYQCPHCAYACIQSSTYKTHLRNKHPGLDDGLLFSCPHCPFRTIKRENHATHVAEHQKDATSMSTTAAPATSTSASSAAAPQAPTSVPATVTAKPPKPKSASNKQNNRSASNANATLQSNKKAPPNTKRVPANNGTIKKSQQAANKKKPVKIARSTEEVIRDIKKPRATKKSKTAPNASPPAPQAAVPVAPSAQAVETPISQAGNTLPENNLQFMYNPSSVSSIENLLQPGYVGTDDSRYPMLSSQLKMSLGDIGTSMFTVVEGKQLLQLGPSDLVPISLSSAQASALQLALTEGNNGEAEQITGDLAEGTSQANVGANGETLEVKFKVGDELGN